eukprot:2236770-Rhodomonas_salina.1
MDSGQSLSPTALCGDDGPTTATASFHCCHLQVSQAEEDCSRVAPHTNLNLVTGGCREGYVVDEVREAADAAFEQWILEQRIMCARYDSQSQTAFSGRRQPGAWWLQADTPCQGERRQPTHPTAQVQESSVRGVTWGH